MAERIATLTRMILPDQNVIQVSHAIGSRILSQHRVETGFGT